MFCVILSGNPCTKFVVHYISDPGWCSFRISFQPPHASRRSAKPSHGIIGKVMTIKNTSWSQSRPPSKKITKHVLVIVASIDKNKIKRIVFKLVDDAGGCCLINVHGRAIRAFLIQGVRVQGLSSLLVGISHNSIGRLKH